MHLYKNFYLSYDNFNFILNEKETYKKGKHKGEEYFIKTRYYKKLSILFEAILSTLTIKELEEETVIDMKDIIQKKKEFMEDIIKVIGKIDSISDVLLKIEENK